MASTREATPDQELEGTSMKSHILGQSYLYLGFFLLSFLHQFFFVFDLLDILHI